MRDEAEFVKNRKKGIGGSDVADILGIGFKTPLEVYMSKISKEDEITELKPNDSSTARMYWGRALEDDILDAYEIVKGVKVKRSLPQQSHPDKPWLIANVDGITKGKNKILVEAKEIHFNSEEFGEEGSDVIPLRYMAQIQHYLNVTGLKVAHLVARINGILRVFEINRDDELIAILEEEVTRFWFDNVQKRIPPEPINIADVKLLYPKSNKEKVKAKPEHIEAVKEISNLNSLISVYKKQLEERKTLIAKYMCANEILETEDGRPLIEYPTYKDGRRTMRVINTQGAV